MLLPLISPFMGLGLFSILPVTVFFCMESVVCFLIVFPVLNICVLVMWAVALVHSMSRWPVKCWVTFPRAP